MAQDQNSTDMDTQGLEAHEADKPSMSAALKAVTAKLDQKVLSPLGRYLALGARLLLIYWLWQFYLCKVPPVEISQGLLQKCFDMDYGSEISFLCTGFLFGIFALSGIMYMARWIWNYAEGYLKKWLSYNLNLLLRYLVLFLLLLASISEIPHFKTWVVTCQTHVEVTLKAVIYKSHTRAQNFGDFVESVKNRPLFQR